MKHHALWLGSVVLAVLVGFCAANFANSQTGDKPKRFPQLTMDHSMTSSGLSAKRS